MKTPKKSPSAEDMINHLQEYSDERYVLNVFGIFQAGMNPFEKNKQDLQAAVDVNTPGKFRATSEEEGNWSV